MKVTHEELAAYADGELEGAEAARVVLAVAASPELMHLVQRHRDLRERIGAEFAPILDQEVPERLAALLRPPEESTERETRRGDEPERAREAEPQGPEPVNRRRALPGRVWLLAPVLAAALAVAAFGGDAFDSSPVGDDRSAQGAD